MYNTGTSSWQWSANNHPLPPFAPWDVGHPLRNPNPLHRVIIAHWSRTTAFWRTVTQTEMFPYICEVFTGLNYFVIFYQLTLCFLRYNEIQGR